jgi:hypothetical protein
VGVANPYAQVEQGFRHDVIAVAGRHVVGPADPKGMVSSSGRPPG